MIPWSEKSLQAEGVAENNSESGSQRISYSGMVFIVGKCRGMAVALYGRAYPCIAGRVTEPPTHSVLCTHVLSGHGIQHYTVSSNHCSYFNEPLGIMRSCDKGIEATEHILGNKSAILDF